MPRKLFQCLVMLRSTGICAIQHILNCGRCCLDSMCVQYSCKRAECATYVRSSKLRTRTSVRHEKACSFHSTNIITGCEAFARKIWGAQLEFDVLKAAAGSRFIVTAAVCSGGKQNNRTELVSSSHTCFKNHILSTKICRRYPREARHQTAQPLKRK